MQRDGQVLGGVVPTASVDLMPQLQVETDLFPIVIFE